MRNRLCPLLSVVGLWLLSGWMASSLPGDESRQASTNDSNHLSDEQITSFARLALDGIDREYPNKPSNVMAGPESVLSPRAMHPAFYGSFDWHSSVHGHWMLVRLLKMYPECSIAAEIKERLDNHLTADHLRREAEYFEEPLNKSFERMYGWAWALRLAAELRTWDDPLGRKWATALRPLEDVLVKKIHAYLANLQWPIRTGVHPDTGFALAQILDYAVLVGDEKLADLVRQRAGHYYSQDRNYPVRYEPSGEDFFSSGLNEVDLMRRILSADEFSEWLNGFFPTLSRNGRLGNLLRPAEVSDITDGKLVHLAGLNFNRAWTMRGIASAIPERDPRRELLLDTAQRHLDAGLQYVFSGHYEGEHWLATFAIYTLTDVGLPPIVPTTP